MDLEAPIEFFNRETGQFETEAIYGEKFLRWAYGNPLGRLTVSLAVKRLWFSRWYGWRMDRPASQAKVAPFIRDYDLDASEFADPAESFASFNKFFYRTLRPDARPIEGDAHVAVFPADGRHLVIPNIREVDTFYIKGQRFNLAAFLGSAELGEEFAGGSLLISRLCPVDYHRFHFPASGTVGTAKVLNGTLSSVSPLALRRRLSIFWENRRSVTVLNSGVFGKMLIVEVGATCVGGIDQTFAPKSAVLKGEEKGYFSFGGSCVVTVFGEGAIRFDEDLLEHAAGGIEVYAKMGQRCGLSA
ncbi:MAG: archaetidylserine decarboxylase [Verrucomicrobiota bacterium]